MSFRKLFILILQALLKKNYYILKNTHYLNPNLNIFINNIFFFFIIFHLRFSLFFYNKIFLLDLYSYEVTKNKWVLIYVFRTPFMIFKLLLLNDLGAKQSSVSIENLFSNAWWLERELVEMTSIKISYMKDTRNLLLVYGENFAPLKKNIPSIGMRELYFNYNYGTLGFKNVSAQY